MNRIDELEREFENMFEEAGGDLDLLNKLTKERLKKVQAENREWERQFRVLMGFQNKGAELERKGRLEDAVTEYQKAIEYGNSSELFQVNNYYHSYERMAIVLRKLKQYSREVDVIHNVLTEELAQSDRSKMKKRLEKALLLMSKVKN